MRVAPAIRPPPPTRRTSPTPNSRSEPEPVDGVVAACTAAVGVELLVEDDEESDDAGAVTVTDLVVVTVVGAVSVVGTVSVVELVTVLVVDPVLVVVVVTVVGTVVVSVLVVPVVTVVVNGTDVVSVVVFVVVVGVVTVVDTVAVVDFVLVVAVVVVVGVVVVVVTVLVVDDVVTVRLDAHVLERTKSSPSGPVPSSSADSVVPESETNALVSVAPPSVTTTTPMNPPVVGWTKVMLSTDPPVNATVKLPVVPVKTQFCCAGTTKCQ